MRLKTMAIRIEEIKRLPLTAIRLPLNRPAVEKPAPKRIKVRLPNRKRVMRIAGRSLHRPHRQTKPQLPQRQIRASIPNRLRLKIQHPRIKIKTQRQIADSKRQMIKTSQHKRLALRFKETILPNHQPPQAPPTVIPAKAGIHTERAYHRRVAVKASATSEIASAILVDISVLETTPCRTSQTPNVVPGWYLATFSPCSA